MCTRSEAPRVSAGVPGLSVNPNAQRTHNESIPQNSRAVVGRFDDGAGVVTAGATTTEGIQEVASRHFTRGNRQARGRAVDRNATFELQPAGPSPIHHLPGSRHLVWSVDLCAIIRRQGSRLPPHSTVSASLWRRIQPRSGTGPRGPDSFQRGTAGDLHSDQGTEISRPG